MRPPPSDVRVATGVGRGTWPDRRLADDLDAHRAGRALDLGGGGLDVVGVEVGHLDRGDLADLVLRDPSYGLTLRGPGPLLDTCCLAQQVRGGRGLQDERERAVLEDRDLG